MADEEQLFDISLEGIERQFNVRPDGSSSETFDVTFHCTRPGSFLEVRVDFDANAVTTLEVMPRAMAEMHRAFAALAAQSAGWGKPEG